MIWSYILMNVFACMIYKHESQTFGLVHTPAWANSMLFVWFMNWLSFHYTVHVCIRYFIVELIWYSQINKGWNFISGKMITAFAGNALFFSTKKTHRPHRLRVGCFGPFMDDDSGKDFKRLSIYIFLEVPFWNRVRLSFQPNLPQTAFVLTSVVVTVSSSGGEDFEKFTLAF